VTTARTRRTTKKDAWRATFLAVLAETGNVSEAVSATTVSRRFVYDERARNAEFAAEWDDALDQASDVMEREALRRAVEGWDEPVFGSMGQGLGSGQVGTVRKYSDTLLIFLLKGARPEKFRERTDVRHSGKIDVSKLSDDELRAIVEG
jgi:hypothetical protein